MIKFPTNARIVKEVNTPKEIIIIKEVIIVTEVKEVKELKTVKEVKIAKEVKIVKEVKTDDPFNCKCKTNMEVDGMDCQREGWSDWSPLHCAAHRHHRRNMMMD